MTGALASWLRARLSDHAPGVVENVVAQVCCEGSMLRQVFDLGRAWQVELQAEHGRALEALRNAQDRSDADELVRHVVDLSEAKADARIAAPTLEEGLASLDALTPIPDTEPVP